MNAMTKKTAPKHDYLVFKTEVRAKAVGQGDMTETRLKGLYCRYLMGTAPAWVVAIVDATPVVKKVDADDDSKLGIGEHKAAIERGIWTTNLILELLSEKPLDSDDLRRLAVARGADIKTVKAQTGKLLGLSKIKGSLYSIYGEKSSGCGRIYCMPEHFNKAKAMAKQKSILSAKEKYKELIGLLSYRPITAIELGALLGRRPENVNVSIRPLVLLGLVEKVQIVRHDQRQGRKSNAYIIGSAA